MQLQIGVVLTDPVTARLTPVDVTIPADAEIQGINVQMATRTLAAFLDNVDGENDGQLTLPLDFDINIPLIGRTDINGHAFLQLKEAEVTDNESDVTDSEATDVNTV